MDGRRRGARAQTGSAWDVVIRTARGLKPGGTTGRGRAWKHNIRSRFGLEQESRHVVAGRGFQPAANPGLDSTTTGKPCRHIPSVGHSEVPANMPERV